MLLRFSIVGNFSIGRHFFLSRSCIGGTTVHPDTYVRIMNGHIHVRKYVFEDNNIMGTTHFLSFTRPLDTENLKLLTYLTL